MKAYCINLKQREDRWQRVQKELGQLGISPIRVEAIWNKVGHLGCIQSHVNVLSLFQDEGIFMVFEDDVLALGNEQDIIQAMDQLPEDWDMLYLGATLTKPLERYSDNLFRLHGGLTTHAMIYNNQHRVCDFIIKNIDTDQVDVFFMYQVQEQFNCFIAWPMIASQFPGYSDTINTETEYTEIMESYLKYTS